MPSKAEQPGNIERSLVNLLDYSARSRNGELKQWSVKPEDRKTWDYRSISIASLNLASFLKAQELQPQDRVVLYAPNSPQWVISYFATLRAGGVVVPFDINAGTDFLGRVIATTRPRMIIAGAGQRDKLPTTGIPVVEMEGVGQIFGQGDKLVGRNQSSSDLAEIVFTSGTTGNPKGVMLTHGNIFSNVEASQDLIGLKPTDKSLSLLPLSHMFETTAGLLVPVMAGASVVYTDTMLASNLMKVLADESITCMAVVPQVLQLFKRGIEQNAKNMGKEKQLRFASKISPFLPFSMRRLLFSSIHKRLGGSFEFFVCGGAPLDPELADAWENFGVKVLQGYGVSEASPVVSADSKRDRNHQYVGRPLSNVEVKIAEEDSEILVRGPNVMSGYWEDPEATADALKNGWYHTGDLGAIEDGRLKILGRKKNMIVLPDGSNVYPEDLEQTLARVGGDELRDSVVFYRKEGGKGKIHVVLLATPGIDPQKVKEIVNKANQHLVPHQRIEGYTLWPEEDFPRTHTRKIKRDDVINSREVKTKES